MRRLLKLLVAGAVAAAAVQLLRRLLGVEDAPSGGAIAESPAPADLTPAERASDGDGPTRDELYREAKEIGVEGRSKMNKRQLQEAVEAAKTGGRH